MADETIFSKIASGELAAEIVYQDDRVTAFRDISPQMPTHVLIVTNRVIPSAADITEADEADLGRMLLAASRIAHDEGIADDGYRLIMNCGHHGRQEVYHLHMHLLGGKDVGPMICKHRTGNTGVHRVTPTGSHRAI